jgi:hypothetical protein
MPGVVAPTVAAKIELILIDGAGAVTMLEVLIAFYLLSSGKARSSERRLLDLAPGQYR